MDRLDIGIIREMLESSAASPLDSNVRKSYSSISRRLKVDENTVRNRIRKLRDSGFLRGWRIAINPNLIGQQMAQLWFDVRAPHTKQEAIKNVSLIPGVAVVKDLFGDSLCVVLYHEGEQSLKTVTELIANITGSKDIISVNEPFPKCRMILKHDDWRIIHGLQKEPTKPQTTLAKELGLSVRTVKRRLSKLIDADALYQVAELNPKSLSGSMICGLLVLYKDQTSAHQVKQKIFSRIGQQLIFANTDDLHHAYFALVVTEVAAVRDILDWALQLPDVAGGRIDIVQDVISMYDVYEEQLEKLLRSRYYAPSGRGI